MAPPDRTATRRKRPREEANKDDDDESVEPPATRGRPPAVSEPVHDSAVAIPAIPDSYVKQVLRQGESQLGSLLQPATELIAACSALYIQRLVQKCIATQNDDDDDEPRMLATRNHEDTTRRRRRLRQVVQEESLLAGVLDELAEDLPNEIDDKDEDRFKTNAFLSERTSSTITAASKPSTAVSSSSIIKNKPKSAVPKSASLKTKEKDETIQNAWQIANDTKVAASVQQGPMNRRQEVVLDEEDYDD